MSPTPCTPFIITPEAILRSDKWRFCHHKGWWSLYRSTVQRMCQIKSLFISCKLGEPHALHALEWTKAQNGKPIAQGHAGSPKQEHTSFSQMLFSTKHPEHIKRRGDGMAQIHKIGHKGARFATVASMSNRFGECCNLANKIMGLFLHKKANISFRVDRDLKRGGSLVFVVHYKGRHASPPFFSPCCTIVHVHTGDMGRCHLRLLCSVPNRMNNP